MSGMKRIYFKLAMIAVMVMAAVSCKVETSERDNFNVADEGYYVYTVLSDEVLNPVLKTLDLALKVDEYASAADRYEQYLIEDRYFPEYKVRLYEDSCVLRPGYAELRFDGRSIRETGASWTISIAYRTEVTAVVTCVGENQWSIDVDEAVTSLTSWRSIDSMDMEASLVSSEDFVYEVSVSGQFTEVENQGTKDNVRTVVTFATTKPTKAWYSAEKYAVFYDGGFNIHFDITGAMERSEDVLVELSNSRSPGVTITYSGDTGYWRR